MASVQDLRLALAGNLAAIDSIQVSPWLLDNPTPGMLQVAGIEEADYVRTMGDDVTYTFIIEGCQSLAAGDKGSQKLFDKWIEPTGSLSVRAALKADKRLTRRWQEDGTVLTGQTALADSLVVRRFRGARRHKLPNGTEVLLGDWVVDVETAS